MPNWCKNGVVWCENGVVKYIEKVNAEKQIFSRLYLIQSAFSMK